MKKFFLVSLLFILFNFIIYLLVINWSGNLGSSSCSSPSNSQYDLLIMGTSHGQLFYNHLTEKILSKKIRNISTGAAGVIPLKILLACFFHANNTTKEIIYFIDPWALYSTRWNENNYILGQASIDFPYILLILENKVDKKIVFDYFIEKIDAIIDQKARKIFLIPKDKTLYEEAKYIEPQNAVIITEEEQKIKDENEDKVRKEILYSEGLHTDKFIKYSEELKDVIHLTKKNNAKIIFIIPPTLMGHLPGHDETVTLLKKYKKQFNTPYYDYSNEVLDRKYYSDREHLNDIGVEYFIEKYLKPVLD